MKLLALGGCGGMGRVAVETARRDEVWHEIVVADRDFARAKNFCVRLADPRVQPLALDVTEPVARRFLSHSFGIDPWKLGRGDP